MNSEQSKKKKLQILKKKGFNYPNNFKISKTAQELQNSYKNYTNKKLKNLNIFVKIAGRIVKKRILGKATFFVLQDFDKNIQIYMSIDNFSNSFYQENIITLDLGDIIGIEGNIFKTKTQELTINCINYCLLSKTLHNLPNKYHGLNDQEKKYRQRYLDLISNKKVKRNFILRSKIISKIRKFMELKKFIEVETPMMHHIPGGANAKPFKTYHNSLNNKLYLRVAPELYLKRLIVGGFNKIFEINRNFRNEGISTKHNPEFTMMELYSTYSNYVDMMQLIQELFSYITKNIKNNIEIDKKMIEECNNPFPKITMIQAILQYNNDITLEDLKNIENSKNIAKKKNIEIESNWTLGEIIYKIFEKTTEKKIIQPTFVIDYPIEISPLSKQKKNNEKIAERFEFFAQGYEIANGFSELNDAEEQSIRFKQQKETKKNDKKNIKEYYDQDYITALEYGLPPTAGLGIGIDRLVMFFTKQKNIKDVILFPTLKN